MALYTVYGLIVRFTRYCITAAKSDSIKLPPQQAVVYCYYCIIPLEWIAYIFDFKGTVSQEYSPLSNLFKQLYVGHGKKVKTVLISSSISRKFTRKIYLVNAQSRKCSV